MPPAPAAIVGQRYGSSRGPWRKLKQIGEGSFGKVFLVQKNGTGPTFVMKEVALRGLPRSEMISAQNEVAVLKKIQHPHCIRIEEALVAEETLCIVMEYADGKDLDTLVKQRKREGKPLSEEEVLKIFWQLTSALAHCHHDLHMLHRDLKPANVFMMASGDVKLGDFGLAKIIEATCALAKTQCGTPLYMSPELCVGKEYDRGADVWALGCILYELMTLTMPWADVPFNGAGGMSALLRKIANSSLDLTPCKKRYSLELVNLCSMLLAKNGKNRPSLNSVLQMDLVKRAAPAVSAGGGGGGTGFPSWRKVPSASRPGEFSYLHVPTGFKQAYPPERDELPEAVLAAIKRSTFSPAQRPPATAMQHPPGTPSAANAMPRHPGTPQHAGTPQQGGTPQRAGTPHQGGTPQRAGTPQQGGTPRQAATPQGVRTPGGVAAPTPPRMGAPQLARDERPLPPNWKKVPSASRPGEFSFLHLPTGFKQADFPTTDAPPPAVLTAWQKAKGPSNRPVATAAAGGGAPPTGAGGWQQQPGRAKLEPIGEQRGNNHAQAPFGAGPKGGAYGRPLAPHNQQMQQQQQQQQYRRF